VGFVMYGSIIKAIIPPKGMGMVQKRLLFTIPAFL